MSDNAYIHILSGGVGAVFNTITGHPFDTVKTKLQDVRNYKLYNSSFNCISYIWTNHGFRGYWPGLPSAMMANVSENMVAFGINSYCKKYFFDANHTDKILFYQEMMTGFISGFVSVFVECPFETIKCNQQVDRNGIKSMRQVVNKFTHMSDFYRGIYACMYRNIPFYTVFFPIYTKYDHLFSFDNKLLSGCIAGGFAGSTTWALVHPLDVIKCNQQVNNMSFFKAGYKIYQNGGIKSFFRGLVPNLIRSFLANASLMFGVELVRNNLT